MARCTVEVFLLPSSHFSASCSCSGFYLFSTSSIHFLACNDANCHDTSTCTCTCTCTCVYHAYSYTSSKSNPICVDLPAKYVSNLYAHIVIPVLGFPVYFLYRFYNFHSFLQHCRVRVSLLSSSQYVKVWERIIIKFMVKWHHFQQSKKEHGKEMNETITTTTTKIVHEFKRFFFRPACC